jgi:DNA-binding transcriptional ArsR family regulator
VRTLEITDPAVVRALGHPLRRRVLSALGESIASPKELAAMLGTSIFDVSYHVRVLRDLGLIRLVERVKRRGVYEHRYQAAGRTYVPDRVLASLPVRVREAFTAAWLQTVGGELTGYAATGMSQPRLIRRRLRLDARGWRELERAVMQFERNAIAIERDAHRRTDSAGLRRATLIAMILGFAAPAAGRAPTVAATPRSRGPRRP